MVGGQEQEIFSQAANILFFMATFVKTCDTHEIQGKSRELLGLSI